MIKFCHISGVWSCNSLRRRILNIRSRQETDTALLFVVTNSSRILNHWLKRFFNEWCTATGEVRFGRKRLTRNKKSAAKMPACFNFSLSTDEIDSIARLPALGGQIVNPPHFAHDWINQFARRCLPMGHRCFNKRVVIPFTPVQIRDSAFDAFS